ncbi:hypothetical protein PI124_g14735 [Phytophthora idaei]|nr:hypothetical protein PI126_g12935 [Phytophthora idaei]KAG3240354.1 hypothetical protein PI124_g14735 [Phytophthora idaei]
MVSSTHSYLTRHRPRTFWTRPSRSTGRSLQRENMASSVFTRRTVGMWTLTRIFSAVCKYLTGLCLVFLGVWTLYNAHQDYTETNVPPSPTHFASSSNSRWSQVQCQDASYVLLQSPNDPSVKIQLSAASAASIGAGIVHGAAGPGCLLAVLPTLAMQKDTLRALLYLGCFCGSSIVSMGSFAALYGELTQRGGRARSPSAAFYVAVASSVLSIGVGTAWVVLQATGVLNRVFGD